MPADGEGVAAAEFDGQNGCVHPDHGAAIVKLSTVKDVSEVNKDGISHGLLAMELYRGLSAHYAWE